MPQSNFDQRNEPLASHASARVGFVPEESAVAIRFTPEREDEGFGTLMESAEQFYSEDDGVFIVRASHVRLLNERNIPFDRIEQR